MLLTRRHWLEQEGPWPKQIVVEEKLRSLQMLDPCSFCAIYQHSP